MDEDDAPIIEIEFDAKLIDPEPSDEEALCEEEKEEAEVLAAFADDEAEAIDESLGSTDAPSLHTPLYASLHAMVRATDRVGVAATCTADRLDRVVESLGDESPLVSAVEAVGSVMRERDEGLAPESFIFFLTAFDAEGKTTLANPAGRAVAQAGIASVGELQSTPKRRSLLRALAQARQDHPDYVPLRLEDHHVAGLCRHAKTFQAVLTQRGAP